MPLILYLFLQAKETAPGTDIDGHKIRVDYSLTDRAHTPTPGQYLGRTSYETFFLSYQTKR